MSTLTIPTLWTLPTNRIRPDLHLSKPIMWLLTAIVTIATVQLPRSHAEFDVQVKFDRHHNEALVGHVIKSISANRLDCNLACTDSPDCRSINSYNNGREMCDLNKSSKTAHPDSIVSKSGYEYDEITNTVNSIPGHSGASNTSVDWHEFNSSLFKLFKERVTWGQARNVCRSLQGHLASIASQQEKDFVDRTLLPVAPRGNITNVRLAAFWKLDGSDMEIKLHGEAAIKTVDGQKTLYLDGNHKNYATTPILNLRTRGFTIGAWVKLLTPASTGLIYGDWSYPYQFVVQVDNTGNVSFKLHHHYTDNLTVVSLTDRKLDFNIWVHIMASWSAVYRTASIYINGQKKGSYILPSNEIADLDLRWTGHQSYDIGLDRNQSTVFHGYIRDLAIHLWGVTQDRNDAEQRMGRWDLFDGVWLGLNDLSKEKQFNNSDGSAVTYTFWVDGEPNDHTWFEDCVAVCLNNEERRWCDLTCGTEMPFICRKKLP